MPYENLLRAVSLAIEADALSRRADDAGLVLQMLVLRLAELPRLKSIEDLIGGRRFPGGRVPAASPDAGPRERLRRGPRPAPGSCRSCRSRWAAEPGRSPAAGRRRRPRAVPRHPRRPAADHVRAGEPRRVDPRGGGRAHSAVRHRQGRRQGGPRGAGDAPAPGRGREGGVRTSAARRPENRARRPTATSARPRARCRARRSRGSARATARRPIPVVRSAMELFRAELTEVKEEE